MALLATPVGAKALQFPAECFSHALGIHSSRLPAAFLLNRRRSSRNALISINRFQVRAQVEVQPPTIEGDLQESLLEFGAELSVEGVPLTFGNDEEALEAAYNDAVVYDMSHFGRLRVTGDDRLRFLHNQTTADIQGLVPGQGCQTVFVTPTARTLDLAAAWVMTNSVILTVSPASRSSLMAMMNKYIFFADKVDVADVTDKTCQLAVIGPRSEQILQNLGLDELLGKPVGSHVHFSLDSHPVTAVSGSGLALPGFQLLCAPENAALVWHRLAEEEGVVPIGEHGWERLRVLQGRPAPGAELTDEFNPLEAALWGAISTTKGCYMGQETIARLITYNGVKQQLWGIQFREGAGEVAPGSAIVDAEGAKVGKITSVTKGRDSSPFALGYVVKKASPVQGLEVRVGEVSGALVEIPFAVRDLE